MKFQLSDLFSPLDSLEEPATAAPVRQMAPPLVGVPAEGVAEAPLLPQVGDRVLHKTMRADLGSGVVISKAQHVTSGACFYVYWTEKQRVILTPFKDLKISNLVLRGRA